PEQIRGGDLTPATDVYQLGITFYELISNQLPFVDGDISFAHLEREVPSLLEVVPDIPVELAALIHRCVEKDPADRFASAPILLEELKALWSRLTHSPLPAAGLRTSSGAHARISDVVPVQKKRKGPLGVVLLLLLVVGLSSIVALSLWSFEDEPAAVVEEEVLVEVLPEPEIVEPKEVEKDEPSRVIWTAQTQLDAARIVALRLASVQEPEPAPRPIPRAPQVRQPVPPASPPEEPPPEEPAPEEPVAKKPASEELVVEKSELEPEPERAPVPVLSLPALSRSSGAQAAPKKEKEKESAEEASPVEQKNEPEEPKIAPRKIPRTF
ncbi:MAG: hypothetical protein ACNA8W_08225, partial [Bradymonadaceae bacterium]